ncbi:MAG: NAD(P)/FAD-dependent oxidoreductase [bacterium]
MEFVDADVIVIGAGAAGLMCAITAAKCGRRTLVLEHGERVGRKILVSGGGRCNFTNLHASPENYLSGHADFCKSALARFTPQDMVAWVERHGIVHHEKKLGQLFCDESSRQIIAMLLQECEAAGVRISLHTRVEDVERGECFRVRTNGGVMESERVVVATGGLSFSKLGASDLGYRIARRFGLKVTEVRPGLVPLVLPKENLRVFGELSGVSVDALVSCGKRKFRENILFTHRGVSGPAILQISSYWKKGEPIKIDLFPDTDMEEWLLAKQQERAELGGALSQRLPRRVVQVWRDALPLSTQMNHISTKRLREIALHLHHWELFPDDTEGYEKAEVTVGGVDTGELSSKTMESKRAPGIYFVGEVVDVTGHLGGYNFQWAWASGFAAGQNV